MDRDLFGNANCVFPVIRPDEALYSWCSAFHRLAGNSQPRTTSLELFGHPSAAFHVDLPFRLEYLAGVTSGHLGSPTEIALERTHAGFHAPFLQPETLGALLMALRGGTPGGLKASLGLPRSDTESATELKACRGCIAEDQSSLPYSYWRNSHQWASSAVCLAHASPLVTFRLAANVRQIRCFVLPSDVPAARWELMRPLSLNTGFRLIRIAGWGKTLGANPTLHLDEGLLRLTYLLKAKQSGWIAMDGTVRLQRLAESFGDIYREVAGLPGWSVVGNTVGVNAGFLGALFRQHPGRRHPLKHILMMDFLFEDFEEFIAAYRTHQEVAQTEGVAGLFKQLTDTRRALVSLVGTGQLSPSHAAQSLGLPLGQALKHLDRVGISRKQRPHVVGTDKEMALRELLATGADRKEICTSLGIRDGFIKDFLARNDELRAVWNQKRTLQRKTAYRRRFLDTLAAHPGLPIKMLRRLPNNGFQWLLRNDKDWLEEQLPGLWRRQV